MQTNFDLAADVAFTYTVDNYNFQEDILFVLYEPADPELDAVLLRVKPGETDEETHDNIMAMAPLENWGFERQQRAKKQCQSACKLVGKKGRGRLATVRACRSKVGLTLQQRADLDTEIDYRRTELRGVVEHIRGTGVLASTDKGVKNIPADDTHLVELLARAVDPGCPRKVRLGLPDGTCCSVDKEEIQTMLRHMTSLRERLNTFLEEKDAELLACKSSKELHAVELTPEEGRL